MTYKDKEIFDYDTTDYDYANANIKWYTLCKKLIIEYLTLKIKT